MKDTTRECVVRPDNERIGCNSKKVGLYSIDKEISVRFYLGNVTVDIVF